MNTRTVAVISGAVLLFTPAGVNALEEGLAALVAAGNKASVQMIDSYYAEVEFTTTVRGTTATRVAEYWRSNSGVRIRETKNPRQRVVDVLIRGGKLNVMTTERGRPRPKSATGMIVGNRNRRAVDTDAWELSLFSLPVSVYRKPPYPIYTLPEAIRKGQVREAEWESLDERRVARLVVELTDERRTYEVWVDPGYNWLVRKCLHTIRDEDGDEVWSNEYQVRGFQEVKPSIFVPVETTVTIHFKGEIAYEGSANLRNIRVNDRSLSAPAMPRPASGTLVMDVVAGTAYKIDANGQRVGPVRRLGEPYSPPMPAPDPLGDSGAISLIGWIAITAAGLLAGAGLVLFWKKRFAGRLSAER